MRAEIPAPVIAVLSEVLEQCETHASLDRLFMYAEAPGDPPTGNKQVKVQEWLRRTNRDRNVEPMVVLGRVLEPLLDVELSDYEAAREAQVARRAKVEAVLARCKLRYSGGIVGAGMGPPTRSLEDLIRGRSIGAIDEEFARAIENVGANPREAVSAACNILESVCKVYIADEKLTPPAKQDLQGVWGIVRKDLGFDPSRVEDVDLKQILSSLLGVVNGIGALRTHASSAHGQGRVLYKLEPRHARLAIHAAHTVVAFVLESWDKKRAVRV